MYLIAKSQGSMFTHTVMGDSGMKHNMQKDEKSTEKIQFDNTSFSLNVKAFLCIVCKML